MKRWRIAAGLVAAYLAIELATSVYSCTHYRTDASWRRDVVRAHIVAPISPVRGDALVENSLMWTRRGRLPAPYAQACDLASTPSGLVVAASIDALGVDGAAIFRIDHASALTRVFAWEGQGFLRVHAYGDRLVVPDADAPFSALAFAFDFDVDGFVFVSDARGVLDESMREIVPRVYHVFDTALLRDGTMVASTGAYHPSDVPYLSRRAPAVLFADNGPRRPWRRAFELPRIADGVDRFTYLLALPDGALLAAVQSNTPQPAVMRIEGLPDHPRATAVPGLRGDTLRWALFHDAVYRISIGGTEEHVQVSHDLGRTFTPVASGTWPQSFAATDSVLFVLDGGELRATRDGEHFVTLAASHPSLRGVMSSLVSAPIAVHEGSVWAASVTTGEIFEATAP